MTMTNSSNTRRRICFCPQRMGLIMAVMTVGLLTLILPGCGRTTPKQRIDAQPEIFAGFPAEVQEKVSQGQIDIGFTRDMVRMALGPADRTYTRTESEGKTAEVWAYTREARGTHTGFSIGVGGGSGGLRTGGGLHVGSGHNDKTHEYLRVVFNTTDRVSAIERTE